MQWDVNMRILVVGAGAIGGYLEAGCSRAAVMSLSWFVPDARLSSREDCSSKSRYGDVAIASPPTMLAEHLREPFDLILVCCKAYDFEDAMASFAPGVAASTAIVPLLNGMRHLDRLDARFGAVHVLGGQCLISAALDLEGRILHSTRVALAARKGDRGGARGSQVLHPPQ